MGLVSDGVDPATLLAVDARARAAHSTTRPTDHTTLGQFRFSGKFTLVASQAANGTLWSLRWTHATNLLVLQYFKVFVEEDSATMVLNDYVLDMKLFVARSFTVSDSAGSAFTPTGNNYKDRTSMATSLIASTDIRCSTAAAGLTVGTRTLDADPVQTTLIWMKNTAPNIIPYIGKGGELDCRIGHTHPIVLAQNEGLVLRGPTTIRPPNGTDNIFVECHWLEVTAF